MTLQKECDVMGLQIDRLRSLRKKRGYRQYDFACALNMSRSAFAMWETGKTEPTLDALAQMTFLLNCTAGYLIGTENEVGEVTLKNICEEKPSITNEELNILELYRKTDPLYKTIVIEIMQSHQKVIE
jgi:transcriptional regulator with XRE-family HTH domain